MNFGVFLSRMQPLHIGHLGIIDKALSENDKLLILIGSANKKDTIRNPIRNKLKGKYFKRSFRGKIW